LLNFIAIQHFNTECYSYKEGREIGRGSFGQVVLGFNTKTGALMAIKQVPITAETEEVYFPQNNKIRSK